MQFYPHNTKLTPPIKIISFPSVLNAIRHCLYPQDLHRHHRTLLFGKIKILVKTIFECYGYITRQCNIHSLDERVFIFLLGMNYVTPNPSIMTDHFFQSSFGTLCSTSVHVLKISHYYFSPSLVNIAVQIKRHWWKTIQTAGRNWGHCEESKAV